MDVYAVIDEVEALLKERGKVSYRSIKLQFELDDNYLEVIKEDLIEVRELAIDKDGRVLIWNGAETAASESTAAPSPPPASYTPTHLAERILAEQAEMEKRGATEGERKTITALFADLKGSTALIEGLDPEEARAIIDPALQLMMDAVHRYDGYVAQALGDGIFALFGAPIAHEDHPQRALYAALQLQEKMQRYSDELRCTGRAPLQTRVGVNTGEVVVRSIRKDDLHTDYVPVGHSTNIAARMEQLADPGSILVTEQTHKLTEGYFEFKALGETQVKGVEGPLNVFEVLGAGPLRTRLQLSARRGLTRFVGRQNEMDQLRQALAQAKDGHGQIVGVMGEPGLGKSRLFYEFKLTSQTGCLVLEAYSVSHGKATPYLPVIELLKNYFQIQAQDDERTRCEKVGGKVLMLDRSLEDTLPYLFFLLGIEDQTSNLHQMDAQVRRQRTLDALKRLFLRESLNQPLMVIFEDLHWIDNETQGFLDSLSESEAGACILLLVNYRPEYRHDWGQKTYYTQLRLAPLGQEEAKELLVFLLGADTSLKALKRLILDRTEGTPFFMEEVVQTLSEDEVLVGERGSFRLEKAVTELHISPTVQGVLAARIDRLGPNEKNLLQQLAVIGREFPLGLVRKVVAQSEDDLYPLLASLQSKEFLYEQPAFPDVEYIFKHALTQEVAYNSVLQEQRKTLHEQTGRAIEALYRVNSEDHYGELAHHYTRGGNAEKAIEYLHLAGQQAVKRSANAEAIRHLTAALTLMEGLPETAERAQQELALRVALGPPLTATKGWTDLGLGQSYTRARELCEQLGDTLQLPPVLWGLWAFYLVRAEYQTARELSEQLWRLAQTSQDPALEVEGHYALGLTLACLGEFPRARVHLEQGIACYDPQQHGTLAFTYGGQDPGVACGGFAAWVLWQLGYPEQAGARGHAALTLARELSHPPSLAFAQGMVSYCLQFRRERQGVQDHAESVIRLSTEQKIGYWLPWGRILHGWVLGVKGQVEEGSTELRQGIAAMRAAHAELYQPYFLALLAEVYAKGGQAKEGLTALAEAQATITDTGERFYEAELHRLKGELTLQEFEGESHKRGPNGVEVAKVEGEAEACFQKAIDIAKHQQAKSWELRAAMSLTRLWQQQGKTNEAYELLSEIYDWFTEGFDTKDLQDAKALLAQLEQAA